MKKLLSLLAGVMFFASASAVTPYKNLYVQAEVYPSGAGVVYLDAKDDDDKAYVYEMSEDFDEKVFIKETFAENGGGDQMESQLGCQADKGMYEAKLLVECGDEYELVCVANQIREDGHYYPAVCYMSHTGTSTNDFQFSWEFSSPEGNLVNVNSLNHPEDGNSDGVGRDGVFALWTDDEVEVDTHLYAIFRKKGETTPYFDPDYSDEVVVPGDVNKDGVCNIDDARAIADKRVGKGSIKESLADINGDGEVNIADAVKIAADLKK